MLLKNFQVGCQILNNVVRNSLPILHFSRKMCSRNGIEWSRNKIHFTLEPKYQKRLEQCPKSSFVQLWCRKLFSKSKCGAITASDDCVKAQQSLKFRIEELRKFVEKKSQSIANDLKSRLDSNRAARTIQLENLLEKTTSKLDELIKLDACYGNWMRKETSLLNDEMRRSFDALERAIDLNEKHIASMLKKLRSDVSTCIESTERDFVACRKHDRSFAKCTKEQSNEATRVLDRMNEETRCKLGKIVRFCETTLKTNEMLTQEAIEINCRKTTNFLKYLDKCIVQLKKPCK